jgi:hypothetical protein
MDNENTTTTAADENLAKPDEQKRRTRARGAIEFPYSDLEAAVDLCQTIQARAGTSCDVVQLASWMNQSASGGTFRTRLGAARMFGLTETHQGKVSLTPAGRAAVDDTNGPAARADAFLSVQLFRAMYEQYQGYALPPPAAIERQMEQLGVPPKQKLRARQTFMKSAIYAGYVDQQTGRFIRPANVAPPPPSADSHTKKRQNGSGGDGSGLDLDPLLMALLRMIPPTEEGWPREQRVRWFRTFAMNVSQIYDKPEEAIDLKIDAVSPGVSS